jgi:DNA-directed RNA polymerase subunit RPC12/RpoP
MQGKERYLVGGAAVVIIALACYFILAKSGGGSRFHTRLGVDGVCLACKQEVKVQVNTTTDFAPYKCPRCNEQAVVGWMFCTNCKKRFVPALERKGDGQARLPDALRCSGCKSPNVETFVPGLITQQPVGDVPLPKLN